MTRTITLAGYIVLLAAIVAYEVRARHRRTATIDDVLAFIVRSRVGRGLLLVAWLWLGWHLFVRVDR